MSDCPQQWQYAACQSWVADDIDLSICREDHRVSACSLTCPTPMRMDHRRNAPYKLHKDAIDPSQLWRHSPEQLLRPNLDVHSHAALVQRHIVKMIRHCSEPTAKRPLKQTLSDDTWALIGQKRAWRNTLATHQKQRKQEMLMFFFMTWKMTTLQLFTSLPETCYELCQQMDEMIATRDLAIAQALHTFRHLGRLVSAATRSDDKALCGHQK